MTQTGQSGRHRSGVRKDRGRLQAALAAHPLLMAAGSAVFLALTVWMCTVHGWRLDEMMGSGRRSAPLWVAAFVGLPLWTLGVAVGLWRAITARRRRGARPAQGREAPDAPTASGD